MEGGKGREKGSAACHCLVLVLSPLRPCPLPIVWAYSLFPFPPLFLVPTHRLLAACLSAGYSPPIQQLFEGRKLQKEPESGQSSAWTAYESQSIDFGIQWARNDNHLSLLWRSGEYKTTWWYQMVILKFMRCYVKIHHVFKAWLRRKVFEKKLDWSWRIDLIRNEMFSHPNNHRFSQISYIHSNVDYICCVIMQFSCNVFGLFSFSILFSPSLSIFHLWAPAFGSAKESALQSAVHCWLWHNMTRAPSSLPHTTQGKGKTDDAKSCTKMEIAMTFQMKLLLRIVRDVS